MSDVNEWLKERRRIREHALTPDERADTENAYPALLAAVESVLALHRPREVGFFSSARMLGAEKECYACNREYPCATVRSIEGAIEGEH